MKKKFTWLCLDSNTSRSICERDISEGDILISSSHNTNLNILGYWQKENQIKKRKKRRIERKDGDR